MKACGMTEAPTRTEVVVDVPVGAIEKIGPALEKIGGAVITREQAKNIVAERARKRELRERVAIAAMQAMLGDSMTAVPAENGSDAYEAFAVEAVRYADAIVAELGKEPAR